MSFDGLENIYVAPLEKCNLSCKYCYTKKTKNVLTNQQILDFVKKYRKYLKLMGKSLKSVLFCGGEVFILPDFVDLVNNLDDKNIFVSVITNGTIDKLEEIKNPNNCQLLVSLDGPKEIHDENRGEGNFDKTINFIKHGINLGFHIEIMFLVTPDSYRFIDIFGVYLSKFILKDLNINFITQKSLAFTKDHPLTCRKRIKSLTQKQVLNIKRNFNSIPSRNFGCSQISLQSNGLIYSCCESPTPIAKISDSPELIVNNFLNGFIKCRDCGVFGKRCKGCSNTDFFCGYRKELGVNSCLEVVNLL